MLYWLCLLINNINIVQVRLLCYVCVHIVSVSCAGRCGSGARVRALESCVLLHHSCCYAVHKDGLQGVCGWEG